MVDHLPGFPIAEVIPNKEAATVPDVIYNRLMLEHTCPKILLSDNGKEFTNDMLAYICHEFNIEQHITSPYMPQSNGKTEDFNRFIKASIRKLCQDDMADWDHILGQILMAYRYCSHTSTGESHVHKLIKPVRPYRGDITIIQKIEQQQGALITAAKILEKKREDQKKSSKNRPSHHNFQMGDLVHVRKHNKEILESKWEPGSRNIDFPTKWTI